MSIKRIPIAHDIRDEVIKTQHGRCALCTVTQPVDFHHIFPVSRGGNNSSDNLILLCRNHHDLADSNIIPPEILRYYKGIVHSGAVILPTDHTVIYEITVNNILHDLLHHYDQPIVSLAYGLLARLHWLLIICLQNLVSLQIRIVLHR